MYIKERRYYGLITSKRCNRFSSMCTDESQKGEPHKSDPTASTTYSTCCGRTNRPLVSVIDMSDAEGDMLLIRLARSMASCSPSRFLPLLSPLSIIELTCSSRLRRAERSSTSSQSLPGWMSKYRTPPQLPSFHWRPSNLSLPQVSFMGTSRPTQGPTSPSTSPM